ncbi:MAG TPA: hypothetical protein VK387_04205 [Thermoleophilaceae bacterium]|nr:hypothetical protein [Thermoleophilaceae bacterium]
MGSPTGRESSTGDGPRFSQDATVVLALARTALPFAQTRTQEAERWLRVMRMHGQVGAALQALGVGEGPLEPPSEEPPAHAARGQRNTAETVERVSRRAVELARRSDAECVGTVHVLFAMIERYGWALDHELYRRGASRDELFARLTTARADSFPY